MAPRTGSRAASGDVRGVVLRAAERCIQRYGIRKTTMDDIAREAGISRPSVYRYFADREDLLIALMNEHSRALTERARRFIAQYPTVEEGLVEGLVYIAEHGHRDEFTRSLAWMDDSDFGHRVADTGAFATLTGEFWDPFLDAAEERGELRSGLDRHEVHVWLGSVGLMLMSILDREELPNRAAMRSLVRQFVLPAFVATDAPGDQAGPKRTRTRAIHTSPRAASSS